MKYQNYSHFRDEKTKAQKDHKLVNCRSVSPTETMISRAGSEQPQCQHPKPHPKSLTPPFGRPPGSASGADSYPRPIERPPHFSAPPTFLQAEAPSCGRVLAQLADVDPFLPAASYVDAADPRLRLRLHDDLHQLRPPQLLRRAARSRHGVPGPDLAQSPPSRLKVSLKWVLRARAPEQSTGRSCGPTSSDISFLSNCEGRSLCGVNG